MSDDFDFDDDKSGRNEREQWSRRAQPMRDVTPRSRKDPEGFEPVLEKPVTVEMEDAPTGSRKVRRVRAERDLPAPRVDRFEAEAEEPNSLRSHQKEATPWILLGSIATAVIWVAVAGFSVIQQSPRPEMDLVDLFTLAVQLLAPAAFALLAGMMGDSLARSNRGSRGLALAAQRMLSPDKMGEKSVRSTAGAVRNEIERLESALGEVTNRLAQIESKVDEKAAALQTAGETARGGAEALVATMESERERLNSLLSALSELTNTAQRTTRTASEGIDERARALAVASETLLDRTEQASELARSAAVRLEQASQRAMDAIVQLDDASVRGEQSLARAHDMMVMARIRADEAIGAVRGTTEALGNAAEQAAGNLGALAQAVQDTGQRSNELFQQHAGISREVAMQLINDIRTAAEQSGREMVYALRAEADLARATGETTLAALQQSADIVLSVTRETGDVLGQTLDANAQRIEALKQSASELDTGAAAALEARSQHARALVQQSVGILDEAGEQIRKKFSSVADACADQARSVEDLLDSLSSRLANLPAQTDKQSVEIRKTLEETLDQINAAGRKALEETAALDAGFQKRLQDSYTAMGELVGRLGGLTGAFQPQFPVPGGILPAADAGMPMLGGVTPPATGAPPSAPVNQPVTPEQQQPAHAGPGPAGPGPAKPEGLKEQAPGSTPNGAPAEANELQAIAKPAPVRTVRYNLDFQSQNPSSRFGRPQSAARSIPDRNIANAQGSASTAVPQEGKPPQPNPVQQPNAQTGPQDLIKPMPAPGLRGRSETVAKGDDPGTKPQATIEPSAPSASNDPFSGYDLRRIPPSGRASDAPWRWREVLSALEPDEGPLSDTQVAGLVREFALQQAIPDGRLEQMRGRATRGRDTARADAVAIAKDAVFSLRSRFEAEPTLRARAHAFVELKRALVARGNLTGDQLRFYLIADAALD
jgi:hypothetical protein